MKTVVGMIVLFVEDGFMVVFVPLIELKDDVDWMDCLVSFKNVELERYI